MPRYLKTGLSDDAKADADAQVRRTVEEVLADIEARGDAAVREYSERFDGWSPAEFRLSRAAIDACYGRVSARERADIEFAQEQIRNFAEIQKGALARRRARDDARRRPRPPEHPGEQRRLLRAGGQVPDGRLRPHERGDREGRGG